MSRQGLVVSLCGSFLTLGVLFALFCLCFVREGQTAPQPPEERAPAPQLTVPAAAALPRQELYGPLRLSGENPDSATGRNPFQPPFGWAAQASNALAAAEQTMVFTGELMAAFPAADADGAQPQAQISSRGEVYQVGPGDMIGDFRVLRIDPAAGQVVLERHGATVLLDNTGPTK